MKKDRNNFCPSKNKTTEMSHKSKEQIKGYGREVLSERATLQVYITTNQTIPLTLADTYYTVGSTGLTGELANEIYFNNTTGEMIYTGTTSKKILFLGSADISSDNNSNTTTFGIFINGVLHTGGETPTDFTSLDKLKNIGINHILYLNPNDIVTIRVKCNVAGTTLTAKAINLTLFE